MKYIGEDKEKCRTKLFDNSVGLLVKAGIQITDIHALILVDGTQTQAKDLESLLPLGLLRPNIWVISEQWSNDARTSIMVHI
jgi:hypothetical protein